MTIKVMKKQGQSIKAIARETGLSKNTVKKYLRDDSPSTVYKRKSKPGKLDPFKDYIRQRIEAAHPDWIPASVLFEEILELGFTGKVRIVSKYVATLRPAKTADPLVRFETPPGKQMQA